MNIGEPYGISKAAGGESPKNIAKMESCVSKLMKTGKSKVSAIRICKTSIESEACEAIGDIITKSGSLDEQRMMVGDAVRMYFKKKSNKDYVYTYMTDFFADRAICDYEGHSYSISYSIDRTSKAGPKVILGDPVKVEKAYRALESHRVLANEITVLEAGTVDSYGNFSITVIRPGFNKSKTRYYSAEMLKRDHGVFEGVKMFADHPTEAEERARPEGSVRNWVATAKSLHVRKDGSIGATAIIHDESMKTKLSNLMNSGLVNQMGISIRAVAEGKEATIDGIKTTAIERLVKGRTVDFVTYPGAGGQVEAMESAVIEGLENDLELTTIEGLRERRPDLIQIIESQAQEDLKMSKTVEELQTELTEALAAANTAEEKLLEAEKARKQAEAKVAVEKLLSESKLPDVAKVRLRKQFETSESDAGVKEAIVAETEYIASVSPAGGVRNMGDGKQNQGGKKVNLKESFMSMGMDEKQAEIAAAGR